MKKLIALVLTIVMVLSMVVVAGAADFNDAADIDVKNTEAVTVLSALGILAGYPDGTFKPDDILNRAAAAKILAYVMLGKDGAEALPKGTSTFKDVPASNWASPYVEFCASKGIVAGDGKGGFNPNGQLTGFAFGKMLLVACGFDANEYSLVGASWEKNTYNLLNETLVSRGVAVSNDKLSRENACHLALNALFYGEVENPENTLAFTVYGVTRMGTMGEQANLRRPNVIYTSTEDSKYWETTDLMIQASPFYVHDGVLPGNTVYKLAGDRELTVDNIDIYRNGVYFNKASFADTKYDSAKKGNTDPFDRTETGITTEVYYDAAMDVYTFCMYGYRPAKIVDVTPANVTSNGEVLEEGSVTLESYDAGGAITITVTSNEFTAEDVGSFCMYNGYSTKPSWNYLENAIEVVRGDIVTGKLTSVDKNNSCRIGGKAYKYNRFKYAGMCAGDYIENGGAEGDTVKGLVYNGILYAVWAD